MHYRHPSDDVRSNRVVQRVKGERNSKKKKKKSVNSEQEYIETRQDGGLDLGGAA